MLFVLRVFNLTFVYSPHWQSITMFNQHQLDHAGLHTSVLTITSFIKHQYFSIHLFPLVQIIGWLTVKGILNTIYFQTSWHEQDCYPPAQAAQCPMQPGLLWAKYSSDSWTSDRKISTSHLTQISCPLLKSYSPFSYHYQDMWKVSLSPVYKRHSSTERLQWSLSRAFSRLNKPSCLSLSS